MGDLQCVWPANARSLAAYPAYPTVTTAMSCVAIVHSLGRLSETATSRPYLLSRQQFLVILYSSDYVNVPYLLSPVIIGNICYWFYVATIMPMSINLLSPEIIIMDISYWFLEVVRLYIGLSWNLSVIFFIKYIHYSIQGNSFAFIWRYTSIVRAAYLPFLSPWSLK